MQKIIILTSTGGGGHMSVSNALKQYLDKDYRIEEILLFKHILKSLDPLMSAIFGKFNGENIYNFFMRKKYFTLANLLYKLGACYFTLRSKKIQFILKRCLQKHKPDLVISVIPIINKDVFVVTKMLNIPFLLIPTDLDITTFLHRLDGQPHPGFKLSLPFDDDEIRKAAEKKGIDSNIISINGFPLRPTFFKEKNSDFIKKKFCIPSHKSNILLLMGTQGSNDMLRFVRELAELDFPTHLTCCIGKNESLRKMLTSEKLPEHITISIIGFTKRIADLMDVADLIITKSGSVSVCESMYSKKPTLLDATTTVLQWERFNHHFFTKHQIGGVISASSPIATQVKEIISDKKLLESFKKNLEIYCKEQPHINLPKLINRMIKYKSKNETKASVEQAFVSLSLSSTVKHK